MHPDRSSPILIACCSSEGLQRFCRANLSRCMRMRRRLRFRLVHGQMLLSMLAGRDASEQAARQHENCMTRWRHFTPSWMDPETQYECLITAAMSAPMATVCSRDCSCSSFCCPHTKWMRTRFPSKANQLFWTRNCGSRQPATMGNTAT